MTEDQTKDTAAEAAASAAAPEKNSKSTDKKGDKPARARAPRSASSERSGGERRGGRSERSGERSGERGERRGRGHDKAQAPVVERKISRLASLQKAAAAPTTMAAALAPAPAFEESKPVVQNRRPGKDEHGRAVATGRRKESIARVWLKPGKGQVTINGRDQSVYLSRGVLRIVINQPFQVAGREKQYDVMARVTSGGLSGQAGALRLAIARALVNYEPELRGVLKAGGFLTRDARAVERKKYGLKKARRAPQFSKR